MKLISWNVNGLRACLTHGFAESFAALDADIFSVQETKMQPGQADFAPDGYTEYTYSAEKKGYSGTACWCREQPNIRHNIKRRIPMKLISWNVNGLRACLTHGFAESFAALDADIFSVQETKMQPGQADFAPDGYTEYTYSAEKKGYSGTACWCREQPLSVTTGIGIEQHDHEGRVLTLEYPGFWLVNCYTPNSQDGLKRLDYRMEWEDAFRAYLLALDAKKPVILCGDLNVAHREIDIKNDKTNHMSAGFTDQERGKMTELLDAGFADSFRVLHPDEVKYSWWSYRFHAREKNAGWRIDYFIVSRRIADKIRAAEIHNEIFGSDHCPVELDIDL